MLTKRQKAARKGARTRAANALSMKRWLEVDKPAHEATVALANRFVVLPTNGVCVRYIPQDGRNLRKGATHGTLLKVLGTGLMWRVLPDGYKHPMDWHAGFWELV